MKLSVILLYAAGASLLVSIPLSLAAMSFAGGTGSWADLAVHPGFWLFYGKSVLWMFLMGFLASVLTLRLIARRIPRE